MFLLTAADVADEDVEGMGLSTAEDGVDDVVEVVDDTRMQLLEGIVDVAASGGIRRLGW